jgi:asparagine synthase (glutamine-hydrolysing)
MCGIAGFVGQGNHEDLNSMSEAIAYRGPDNRGEYRDKQSGLFFAHRRLSIVDKDNGAQPMQDSTANLVIVFNGEIYNCFDLRKQLIQDGYVFRSSHSDTEVLLNGYRKWGNELPNHLNGMFAFAIYDNLENKIFLARDRFGEKPLYYFSDNKNFIFSSELKSLTQHSVVKEEIDNISLQKYFAYGYLPGSLTIYKKCFKLKPAHYAIFNLSSKEVNTRPYWSFKLTPDYSITNEDLVLEELDYLLGNAVESRLMSDMPLGFFLSGGLDSSSVLAYATKLLDKEQINSFTIGFKEKSFDESSHAKRVSDFLGINNHLKILNLDDVKSLCPQILAKLDEPIADASILPTYFLSEFAKKHVSVALSGDGGDEMFAGYDPFSALKIAEYYNKFIPNILHNKIIKLADYLPISRENMSFDFKVKRALKGLSYKKEFWNPVWLAPACPEQIQELFQEPLSVEELYSEVVDLWDATKNLDMLSKTMEYYTHFYLPSSVLTKLDRASMLNSLETRAVFLDKDLAEFCMKLPNHFKYKNGCRKYILKRLLRNKLPAEVLTRKKKGFGMPISKWLMNFPEHVPMQKLQNVNMEKVNKLWGDHRSCKQDNRLFMWSWFVLQTFIK